jgi:hypothetical protein
MESTLNVAVRVGFEPSISVSHWYLIARTGRKQAKIRYRCDTIATRGAEVGL